MNAQKVDNSEYNIAVIIDGECNHASVEIEQYERDFVNPHGVDTSQTDAILVCTKCKAWRYDEDSSWEGLTFMPMIIGTNRGKVFHDVRRSR